MSDRFLRYFELVIGLGADAVIVRPDFRINFSVEKSTVGGLNKATIKVYNIEQSKRLQFVKNIEPPPKGQKEKYIPIQLSVGYDNKADIIFKGNVQRGSNDKQGNDFISTFDCLDGGYDNNAKFISKTVKGEETALNEVLKTMDNTTKGKITELVKLLRPKVLFGNPFDVLRKNIDSETECFIDNEQIYIVKKNEVVTTFIPEVSNSTGLLGTPQIQFSKISFETMLNPALKMGGLVQLISEVNPHLNGVYRIQSMNYTGDNWGNDWKQSVTGFQDPNFKNI